MSNKQKSFFKPNTNPNKFNEGDTIRCIKSTSVGYHEGGTYEVYKNSNGDLCIKGEDGYEDHLTLVLSTFKKVD